MIFMIVAVQGIFSAYFTWIVVNKKYFDVLLCWNCLLLHRIFLKSTCILPSWSARHCHREAVDKKKNESSGDSDTSCCTSWDWIWDYFLEHTHGLLIGEIESECNMRINLPTHLQTSTWIWMYVWELRMKHGCMSTCSLDIFGRRHEFIDGMSVWKQINDSHVGCLYLLSRYFWAETWHDRQGAKTSLCHAQDCASKSFGLWDPSVSHIHCIVASSSPATPTWCVDASRALGGDKERAHAIWKTHGARPEKLHCTARRSTQRAKAIYNLDASYPLSKKTLFFLKNKTEKEKRIQKEFK